MTHNSSIEDSQSSEDLEARSQELKGTIGIATGVLLGPLTILTFFLVLNGLEPRALGTYSFLIGGPLVLALAARAPQRGILKSFGMTLTQIRPQGRTTEPSLSCRYTVHTTVTPYAHAVAGLIIRAFERDLLRALASRFEHGLPTGGTVLIAESR